MTETSTTASSTAHARLARSMRAGIGFMLLSMFCFAAMDAVSKALAQSLSIPQILWVRYIIFTVLTIALLRHLGLRRVMHSKQPLLQTTRALLIVIENGLFVLAFKYLPLADVHAVAAASPLIVVALSVPMLGEQVGPRRWAAVCAGFAGVLLIVRPGFQEIGLPMLIVLSAALLWGLYQILVRKCAQTDSSQTTWAWTAVVGLAATSLVGPLNWVWPDQWGWIMLFGIAILGSGAHVALIRALSIAEAGALQPFSYTLLLWAAVFGWLAFGQIPDRWTILGAGVILASGLYAWHRERLRMQGRN